MKEKGIYLGRARFLAIPRVNVEGDPHMVPDFMDVTLSCEDDYYLELDGRVGTTA